MPYATITGMIIYEEPTEKNHVGDELNEMVEYW